jgi:hypothetical protein
MDESAAVYREPEYTLVSTERASKLLGASVSTIQRRVKAGTLPGEVVPRAEGDNRPAIKVWVPSAMLHESSGDTSDGALPATEQPSLTAGDAFAHTPLTHLEMKQLEPLFSAIGESWVRPILAELSSAREQAIRRGELLGELRAEVRRLTDERDASRSSHADVSEENRQLERQLADARAQIAALQALVAERLEMLETLVGRVVVVETPEGAADDRGEPVERSRWFGWWRRFVGSLG